MEITEDDQRFEVNQLSIIDQELLDFDWVIELIGLDDIFDLFVPVTFGSGLDVLEVDIMVFSVLDNSVKEEEDSLEVTDSFKDLDDIGNTKFLIVGNSHIDHDVPIGSGVMLHQVIQTLVGPSWIG